MFSRVPAAAVLTGAAGLIHAAAAVTHVGETVLLGLLFALTGWAQVITAVWLSASHSRTALWVMTATNVAALAAWAASRTVGLPVLHPGVEPAGTADVLTVALEVLALGAAVALVRGRRSEHPARRALPIGLATAGLFALGASGAAVVALGSGGGHGHAEEVAAASEADGHGHDEDSSAHGEASTEESGQASSRQPGTLPAALHRHRPGIYHLHEDIDLHRHGGGIVHVHTKAKSGPSPSPSAEPDSSGEGDHHDDGGHAH